MELGTQIRIPVVRNRCPRYRVDLLPTPGAQGTILRRARHSLRAASPGKEVQDHCGRRVRSREAKRSCGWWRRNGPLGWPSFEVQCLLRRALLYPKHRAYDFHTPCYVPAMTERVYITWNVYAWYSLLLSARAVVREAVITKGSSRRITDEVGDRRHQMPRGTGYPGCSLSRVNTTATRQCIDVLPHSQRQHYNVQVEVGCLRLGQDSAYCMLSQGPRSHRPVKEPGRASNGSTFHLECATMPSHLITSPPFKTNRLRIHEPSPDSLPRALARSVGKSVMRELTEFSRGLRHSRNW